MSLLQIATPSRGAIEAYGNLQNELAKLVSDVNGRHGEVDWTPIRYLNKGFSQTVLAGLYRTAQVGVVTPLHDGMNLVAKEYVAAQNPADPGVLVLSKFAGAANELDTALLVNPNDIDGMARTIATAVSMPLTERRLRWEAMMEKLHAGTIQGWFADFVDALQETRSDRCAIGAAIAGAAAGTVAAALGQQQRAVSLERFRAKWMPVRAKKRVRRESIRDRSSSSNTRRHRALDTAPLSGALGFSSGTTPLPWPTNTPCPTITDDLLPMITLGCGEVRLDRVPSAQMIVSPESMPRRPSSQLTSTPCRVQACASAGAALPAIIADIKIQNASARSMVMSPLRPLNRGHILSSRLTGFRFSGPQASNRAQNYIIYSVSYGNIRGFRRPHLQKSPWPFKRGHPERWPSGLRRTLGKRAP